MPAPCQPTPHRPSGFTLLELLVVLTIMGFLMAMVAPRLAGTGREAAATLTHTNMGRLQALITYSLQKDGRYPTGLINIVSVDGSDAYHKPMVSDGNPDTGFEILSDKLDRRHRLSLHHLNEQEVEELRGLGVVRLYNYNSPDDRNLPTHASPMHQVAVGAPVLMTAGGDNGTGIIQADQTEANRAHPDDMFRIMFGLGPDASLVTNGLIQGAAISPESTMADSDHAWRWYILLLPRLKATEKRLRDNNPLSTATNGTVTVYAVNGPQDAASLSAVVSRHVDAYAAQHPLFFAVLDCEGTIDHFMDLNGWGIDFNADGEIN